MGAFDSTPNITIPNPDKPDEAAAFRAKWKWEPHEQVLIKGIYTTADQETVENASSGVSGKGKGAQADLRIGSSRRRLLEVMIVDWTLAQNGRKVEVSSAAIARLPSTYREPILEEIDKVAGGMDEEEQEDFTISANGRSSETLAETSLSLSPS